VGGKGDDGCSERRITSVSCCLLRANGCDFLFSTTILPSFQRLSLLPCTSRCVQSTPDLLRRQYWDASRFTDALQHPWAIMKTSHLFLVLETDHSRNPTPLSNQLQHPHARSTASCSCTPTISVRLGSGLGPSHRHRRSFHGQVCIALLFVFSVSDYRLFRLYSISLGSYPPTIATVACLVIYIPCSPPPSMSS
jgi:hypothetical protein